MENRPLQPTQALLPAPGTLQQFLWVSLPGWEGRVQRGGPPDKPEECAGPAEMATMEADASPWPWRWEGSGSGQACSAPTS